MIPTQYYFGDHNLPRDRFLKEQLQVDDGWVTLETMLKFNRFVYFSLMLSVSNNYCIYFILVSIFGFPLAYLCFLFIEILRGGTLL